MRNKRKKNVKIRFLTFALAAVTGFTSLSLPTGAVRAEEVVQTVQKAAKKQDKYWDYKNKLKETHGAYTYCAVASQNKKEAWIYRIKIDTKKKHAVMNVPKKIDGKKVTRIGYSDELYPDKDEDESFVNIFGVGLEPWHNWDGDVPNGGKITKVTLPDSIKAIELATFSGMDDLKSIRLPKKLTVIERYLFYGCENLEKVTLPDGLKELKSSAFVDCPKLKKLVLSSKNKVYQIKNGCVIAKKGKALTFAFSKEDTLKIPDGVKSIKPYALCNCQSAVIDIPESVSTIEADAFHTPTDGYQNEKIKNVTVSEKNEVYARDGQCIYNKKNETLAVAIPDDDGVLYISEKVRRLDASYCLVNCDQSEKRLEKVVFPKQLEAVTVPGFHYLGDARKVYFTGANPPEIKGVIESVASLPIFTNIYVPKEFYQIYKDWYKKYGCWDYIDEMYKY